jgi:hypothetical protein
MDTVPNKVDQLFRAQVFHDRKQREERAAMTPAQRAKAGPPIDYLRPLIADADTGHGGLTATMRLVKMFVERGAAGMHVEDQVSFRLVFFFSFPCSNCWTHKIYFRSFFSFCHGFFGFSFSLFFFCFFFFLFSVFFFAFR